MSGIERKRLFLKTAELFKSSIHFILFPSRCSICKKNLKFGEHVVCDDCLKTIKNFSINEEKPFFSSRIFFLYKFEDEVRELIHIYKYEKMKPAGKIIGEYVSEFLLTKNYKYDYLIPVPSHKKRIKERGFDHIEYILKYVSKKTGIKILKLLKKTKNTQKQALVSLKEREKNIKNSIAIRENISPSLLYNKRILIFDDVYTTGATIREVQKNIEKHSFSFNLKAVDYIIFAKRE